MKWPDTGNRGIHLRCVVVVVTALTVGVAAPQPGSSLAPVESHPVVLEVAVASAIANSSAAPALAVATAAAVADDPAALPRTVAQISLTALGIALSPLWYLGFPITLPFTASLLFDAGSNLGAAAWGSLGLMTLTPIAWLSFPFIVGSAVAQALFPVPTVTDTQPAASASSGALLPSGITQIRPTRAVQAAVAASGTVLQDAAINIVRFVAGVASVAALPLWWIASPITFPLGAILGWSLTPYDSPSLSNDGIIVISKFYGSLLAGVLGPPVLMAYLLDAVFPPAAATATTARAASRTITRPANPLRRTQTARDFGSPQTSTKPAAGNSKRSIARAAAPQSPAKSKSARAGSSAGKG